MADTNTTLQNQEDVQALLELMEETKMVIKFKDYYDLVSSVDAMEQRLGKAMSELQEMKQMMGPPAEKKNQLNTVAGEAVKFMDESMNDAKGKLQIVKRFIIKNAVDVRENFKQMGVVALDKIVDGLNIKKMLESISNSINRAVDKAEKTIHLIDTASKEFHEMESHAKGIFRALAGKEQERVVKENGRIAKGLQNPLNNIKNCLLNVNKKIDTALFRIEHLERNAAVDRGKIAQRRKVKVRKPIQASKNQTR